MHVYAMSLQKDLVFIGIIPSTRKPLISLLEHYYHNVPSYHIRVEELVNSSNWQST